MHCIKLKLRKQFLSVTIIFSFWSLNALPEQSLADLLAMFSDPQVQEVFKKEPVSLTATTSAHDVYLEQQKKRFDFYNDYFVKYYPKVFVMCNQLFVQMTPLEVEKALQNIIDVLSLEPWLYFANEPKGFKITHYWEYIIDQLSWMSNFLSKAQVNIAEQTVYLPTNHEDLLWNFPFMQRPGQQARSANVKSLSSFLIAPGKTVWYDFYALCFDYVIKLFNEGILLQDMGQASVYLSELEYLAEKLRGSHHEQEYSEAIKTTRDLLSLLKYKLGQDKDTFSDSDMNRSDRLSSWMGGL